MVDKKVKIAGVSVYKRKTNGNKTKTYVLGIPVLKKKRKGTKQKTYLFGVPIRKKKINMSVENELISSIPHDRLVIGFKLKGGLGDILISANYLFEIRELIGYDKIEIDVYAHENLDLVTALFPENNFVNRLFLDTDIMDNTKRYDLFVVVNRYPDIRCRNMKKIYKFAPALIDFIHACEKFKLENERFFGYGMVCDGVSNCICEILKKKRIQQPDIYDFFKLSERFNYTLDVSTDEKEFFDKNKIVPGKFITIHRGVDVGQVQDSVKLWPYDFYNILIKFIKNEFPNIQIVQLAINDENCTAFEGVDVNLVGKASIEDIKLLLKKSTLHIDGEGEFVHLRHALGGGKSVVLFGPSSPEFYGYSENINLRGKGCKFPCEWIINSWQKKCARGYHRVPCMYSLTPEFVFSKIKCLLEK